MTTHWNGKLIAANERADGLDEGLFEKSELIWLDPDDDQTIMYYDFAVPCGNPIDEGDAHGEKFNFLERHLIHPDCTFAMEITGDSMIDAGYRPGDCVFIDASVTPQNGSAVVASVNGDYTLKFFFREPTSGKVFLLPANKDYSPIEAWKCDEFRICGVVVGRFTPIKLVYSELKQLPSRMEVKELVSKGTADSMCRHHADDSPAAPTPPASTPKQAEQPTTPPPPPTTKNALKLPTEVAHWIRVSERAATEFLNAVHSLNLVMGKGADDATWNHIKQVMEDIGIISNLKKASFARMMNKLDSSLSIGSIKSAFSRNNSFFDDCENGRIKEQCFRLWPDTDPDKSICLKVHKLFAQLLTMRGN